MTVIIGKVANEHGCWGNMARFPVVHNDETWLTTEALFQSLRFNDEQIRSEIKKQKSPMAAKMVAKKHKELMVIKPTSVEDLVNMKLCLQLKLAQHPELKEKLIQTGNQLIVEDCTARQHGSGLFWGAALIDDRWVGQNWLGRLWMDIRSCQ